MNEQEAKRLCALRELVRETFAQTLMIRTDTISDTADFFDEDCQLAFFQNCTGINRTLLRLAHRLGFTGQRCLIDHALSGCHNTVKRNDIAHMYDYLIACADIIC